MSSIHHRCLEGGQEQQIFLSYDASQSGYSLLLVGMGCVTAAQEQSHHQVLNAPVILYC